MTARMTRNSTVQISALLIFWPRVLAGRQAGRVPWIKAPCCPECRGGSMGVVGWLGGCRGLA